MYNAKTFALRIAAGFPVRPRHGRSTSKELPAMTWRACCEGCEIGGSYPTREAGIRSARAYREHYPNDRYSIRQVKQVWGI